VYPLQRLLAAKRRGLGLCNCPGELGGGGGGGAHTKQRWRYESIDQCYNCMYKLGMRQLWVLEIRAISIGIGCACERHTSIDVVSNTQRIPALAPETKGR
jgi:hypothetical protein